MSFAVPLEWIMQVESEFRRVDHLRGVYAAPEYLNLDMSILHVTRGGEFDMNLYADSPFKARIEGIGFKFHYITIQWMRGVRHLFGRVGCPCGKNEQFRICHTMHQIENHRHLLDPYYCLFMADFFSPKHLEEDGFPQEVIERARSVYAGAYA